MVGNYLDFVKKRKNVVSLRTKGTFFVDKNILLFQQERERNCFIFFLNKTGCKICFFFLNFKILYNKKEKN